MFQCISYRIMKHGIDIYHQTDAKNTQDQVNNGMVFIDRWSL